MIDRKAFFISGALLISMLAATAWRLALLPDWTHFPDFDPGQTPVTRSSFGLLIAPLCLAFVGGMLVLRERRTIASPEAIRAWKRWGSSLLIIYGAICAALQFFILGHSLGLALTTNPAGLARAGLVLLAVLLVVFANSMPKLPWLQPRNRKPSLDPVRGAQLMRFSATMQVLTGIAVIIVAVFVSQPFKVEAWILLISLAGIILSQVAATSGVQSRTVRFRCLVLCDCRSILRTAGCQLC